MAALRVLRTLWAAGLLAAVTACAAGGDAAQADQEAMCARLIRELSLFCSDAGVRGNRPASGYDCLSRRLEFERLCVETGGETR